MPRTSQRSPRADAKAAVATALPKAAVPTNRAARRHPDTSKDLWGPLDVAAYLELAPNTVYSMLARGEMPGAVRFGRRWKVSVPALMRALHGEVPKAS